MRLLLTPLYLVFALSLPCNASSQPTSTTNLTSYLLTTYAARYTAAITSPPFFGQVKDGTVSPARAAYFFSQDILYGRGFLGLTAQALGEAAAFRPGTSTSSGSGGDGSGECGCEGGEGLVEGGAQEELILSVVDNWGSTASGLADEAGMLERQRGGIVGEVKENGTAVWPSEGTSEYVSFMLDVNSMGKGDGFAGLICAWVMGKVSRPVFTLVRRGN
jgi:hypothetical protein